MGLECWSFWSGGKKFSWWCVVLSWGHTEFGLLAKYEFLQRGGSRAVVMFFILTVYIGKSICPSTLYCVFSITKWWGHFCCCILILGGLFMLLSRRYHCLPVATRYWGLSREDILLKSDIIYPVFSGFCVTLSSLRLHWFAEVEVILPSVAEGVSVPVSHLK